MEKKRLRLRTPFRIILSIIAIIVIVTLYFPISGVLKLTSHDYSFFSSIEIYKLGLTKDILKTEYSDVLDKGILDEDFNIDYLDSYMMLNYYERDDFLKNTNSLLDLKYKEETIDLINSSVSNEFMKVLLKEYVFDIDKYLEVEYFKEENYERYKAYFNGNYEKTVLYVNIGLDKEYYTDTTETDKFSITMLVNKYHGVTEDFAVPDLTAISDECSAQKDAYLTSEAAKAFEKMCYAAKNEGYQILANSSYRDYQTQKDTWQFYYDLYGKSYVDKYVTMPGYSEHQTGLALDVKSANSNIFKNSKEYTWMIDNSYKYGFIHRYKEEKVNITGISSEAWHFRYVGVEAATYMYENNLCLEEYYAMVIDK